MKKHAYTVMINEVQLFPGAPAVSSAAVDDYTVGPAGELYTYRNGEPFAVFPDGSWLVIGTADSFEEAQKISDDFNVRITRASSPPPAGPVELSGRELEEELARLFGVDVPVGDAS